MRELAEIAEGFVVAFTIGVVVLLGAATLIHAVSDKPEPRADLISPPVTLLCPDEAGHCRAN